MPEPVYSLAIETSSRSGSISLGRGDELLQSVELPEQQRHAVELMPAIDRLCQQFSLAPAALAEIHVSIGPGSFTGLRIGVTTAKTLAWLSGARLVAVPTLDVVVRNTPPDWAYAAVMLNAKREQCFTGIYERVGIDGWRALIEPSVLTPAGVLSRAPRPLAILADKLPAGAAIGDSPDVECLGPMFARPRSSVVWQLGRERARRGAVEDPASLTPLYVRLPEAEEVWMAKQS